MKTWKFDISGGHSLLTVQNPVKKFISKRVQSVRPKLSHKLEVFSQSSYGLVGVLWQIIPYCLQDFLQLVDDIWLGLKCLVAFKHSFPDMVIKRIKVW